MFEKARLKLTAWYLLIIMLICFLFSLVIFRTADTELRRIGRRQYLFQERFNQEIFRLPVNEELFTIDVGEIRERVIIVLIIINSGILLIAGLSGYFLAGRTLKPIKNMVDDQNRFISDASHELRTPLTSLKSAMEVHLRDKNLTLMDSKVLIGENLEDVNKLEKLTNALLELSRFQITNHRWSFESAKINEIAKEAIRKIKPLAKKKNIDVRNQTGNFSVEGLRQELTDLLVILLDNAVKYSPAKKTIVIESKKIDGAVLISVKDNGFGIDKKDLPFIFDRFYRSEEGRSKSKVPGYGLGLSIAKKIVTLHRGTISVESKVNAGTTFTIHLPTS